MQIKYFLNLQITQIKLQIISKLHFNNQAILKIANCILFVICVFLKFSDKY